MSEESSARGTTAMLAEVLANAALPIQSNEAWGAHDAPRHRERIRFVGDLFRERVLAAVGIGGSG